MGEDKFWPALAAYVAEYTGKTVSVALTLAVSWHPPKCSLTYETFDFRQKVLICCDV